MIETDILLALISVEDKHHAEAIGLLDKLRGDVSLSPYSLVELDLLLRSREIVVKDVKAFYDSLGDLLDFREISTLSTKPKYHGEAFGLRKTYGNLSYFDSLHASVGIVEDIEVVSYNKEYAKAIELKYNHPDKYLPRK